MQQQIDVFADKPEKKERSSRTKDKKEKISDEEKELRKERKMGRKRVGCGDFVVEVDWLSFIML